MIHSIRGGLWLEANKQRSTRGLVRPASIPDELVIPLDQHAGDAAMPLVKPGDAVLLGQPIAQPGSELSAWLHSPVSGTVAAIEPRPTTQHVAPCVVVRNDGRDTAHSAAAVDFQSLSPAALCEHIARGGIVGLGGATFPTNVKLTQASGRQGLHLLLNGAECEPWISCDDVLMRERAADVIYGSGVLRHALGATRCTIAVEDDVPEAAAALRTAAAGSDIAVAVVSSLYPAGGERQLIYAVTGNEVPSGGLPSDIAVVCQNVGTAAAVARWLRDSQPLISRIVTITGSGVREPANLEVRIGTPIATLIADCGGYVDTATQLIMGGSMMGLALASDALPTVKGTNCVIVAAGTDLHARGAEMPCIRCGYCSEVCPASLLPQQLHWAALAGDIGTLDSHGLLDCIECGCCDYVCPSQIPLTQRFRDAKPALVATLTARIDAAAARARYEAREHRLANQEQQQRARLEEKRRQLTGRKA